MLLEPYFEGQNESVEVVRGLFDVLTNLTILATAFLLKDLSAKNFVVIGTSMTFFGLLLTAHVTSLTQLIFSFSVIVGVGLGLLNPAAFVGKSLYRVWPLIADKKLQISAVLSCFTYHRVYAISFGFAALGLGQTFMPILVKAILANFSLKMTYYIVSAVSLIGVLGAHCLVPIKWRPCPEALMETQPLLGDDTPRKVSIFTHIVKGTDLDLLSNLKYITIVFGLSLVYASSCNMNVVLPIFLQVLEGSFH